MAKMLATWIRIRMRGGKKADDGADNNCILVNTMARTALGESRMAEIYQDIGAIQGLI